MAKIYIFLQKSGLLYHAKPTIKTYSYVRFDGTAISSHESQVKGHDSLSTDPSLFSASPY